MNLAHISKEGKRYQTLKEHSRNVAEYTSDTLSTIGMKNIGILVGLLHDGKASGAFQKYLQDAANGKEVVRGSVIHTFQGVKYILDKYHQVTDTEEGIFRSLTSEIIAVAVGSHHGFFDCYWLDGENGFQHRQDYNGNDLEYEQVKKSFEEEISTEEELNSLFDSSVVEIVQIFTKIKSFCDTSGECFFMLSLLIRVITSALMNADRRDTAEFYEQRDESEIKENFNADIDYIEKRLSEFNITRKIDEVRSDISEQCKEFAKYPTDIYQLNVPTGGGKTLSSLRYALYHAVINKKRKIIFTAPLLSIIDQNAEVIKEFLPESAVYLQHHSDVIKSKLKEEEWERYELLSDRWIAPIIYTTQFQVLSILFDGGARYITRMQALIDSVIIFDEVQSIPRRCVKMFSGAIKFLKEICHTTIILSSATQPDFNNLTFSMKSSDKEMVHLSDEKLRLFHRNEIIDLTRNALGTDELAGFIKRQMEIKNSFIVVCNTKREVSEIYELLRDLDYEILVLTANECKAHRKEIISQMMVHLEKLRNGETDRHLLVLSTQIIEAGVDVSFESGIRILAGIDNIIQTAGRISRNGEFPAAKLYVIRLKNENLTKLQDIRDAQYAAGHVLFECKKFEGKEASEDYYHQYFCDKQLLNYPVQYKRHIYYLTKWLENELNNDDQDYFLKVPFLHIGKFFKVFDDEGIDVLVSYKKGKELINQFRHVYLEDFNRIRELTELAREYTVKIYEYQFDKLYKNGMIEELLNGHLYALSDEAYGVQGIEFGREYDEEDFIL